MKITCFLSLLFIAASTFTFGQGKLEIDSRYVIDSTSASNIRTVKSKNFKSFAANQEIDIGYNKNAAIWCYFKIRNIGTVKIANSWLCFDNYHIDSLVVYEGEKVLKILGDRTSYRSTFLHTLAFPISLDSGKERIFYVKIKKQISKLNFSYHLADSDELSEKSNLMISIVSFFIGIVFLLILFNTILLLISKKKLFLFYILYSILSIIYILISTNYAKQLLFPEFLYYSEGRMYSSCFWIMALTSFLSHYLNLRKFEPIKYRIILGVYSLNLCLIVVTIIQLYLSKYDGLKLPMLLGYLNFLIGLVVILWSTILHLRINRPIAIYILLSFLPQMVWGTCVILNFFGLIPVSVNTDWLVYISLYEILFFGYILTKNYIDTFQTNNKLVKEITIEKERSLQAITQVQIRERRSIANIIHDNFGSKLAYILQMIQLKNIALAEKNIKVLASDIREISHQILPKSLDEGALISSLNSQVVSLNTGLIGAKIDLFTYDFPEKIENVWIYDLYLIALEIINNALKHGNSRSVILELYGYPDAYVFQFSDNGEGFDLNRVAKGFGLENIEKRIKYYKGEFEINSKPGEGTIIQITMPHVY